MADRESEPGRAAQRRRTRKAIVAAAAELLGRGRTPSVAEVAEAAELIGAEITALVAPERAKRIATVVEPLLAPAA